MSIKINREIFATLAPKSNRALMFNPNSTVLIISFDEDAALEWGSSTVPGITVEVDGDQKQVPAPAIMGAIVSRPGILYNEGQSAMECVDFVNNSLFNYLDAKTAEGEDITLPDSITVLKRVNKGVAKSQIDAKKEVYEESFLVEEGKTFDETFVEHEFIPTVFKSPTGTVRTNGTYLIDSLD